MVTSLYCWSEQKGEGRRSAHQLFQAPGRIAMSIYVLVRSWIFREDSQILPGKDWEMGVFACPLMFFCTVSFMCGMCLLAWTISLSKPKPEIGFYFFNLSLLDKGSRDGSGSDDSLVLDVHDNHTVPSMKWWLWNMLPDSFRWQWENVGWCLIELLWSWALEHQVCEEFQTERTRLIATACRGVQYSDKIQLLRRLKML